MVEGSGRGRWVEPHDWDGLGGPAVVPEGELDPDETVTGLQHPVLSRPGEPATQHDDVHDMPPCIDHCGRGKRWREGYLSGVTGALSPVHTIDARMHGKEHNLSCYFLPGPHPTLVEPGPESSLPTVVSALHELGVGRGDLAYIVVTHVHLDHAGGAGLLAELFPDATVVVHEQGARHLRDPARLWASASRVYGEGAMATLWGSMRPLPVERLRAVDDGDHLDLGGGRRLEVLYTPGHARHHVCLVDTGTGGAFVGDAVGVTLPHSHLVRPNVPPPDVDVTLIVEQMERLRARKPTSINFAHFGVVAEAEEVLDQAMRRVRRWDDVARSAVAEGLDVAALAVRLARAAHEDYVAEGYPPDVIAATEERTNYETEASGLHRAHSVR